MSKIKNPQFSALIAAIAAVVACGDNAGVAPRDESVVDVVVDSNPELGFDLEPHSDIGQDEDESDLEIVDVFSDAIDLDEPNDVTDTVDAVVDSDDESGADADVISDQDGAFDIEVDAIEPCETTVCGPDNVCCPADTECQIKKGHGQYVRGEMNVHDPKVAGPCGFCGPHEGPVLETQDL